MNLFGLILAKKELAGEFGTGTEVTIGHLQLELKKGDDQYALRDPQLQLYDVTTHLGPLLGDLTSESLLNARSLLSSVSFLADHSGSQVLLLVSMHSKEALLVEMDGASQLINTRRFGNGSVLGVQVTHNEEMVNCAPMNTCLAIISTDEMFRFDDLHGQFESVSTSHF